MHKTRLLVCFTFGLLFLLSACQAAEGWVEITPHPTATMAVVVPDHEVLPTKPVKNQPEVTPQKPILSEETEQDDPELDCDEPFCLIEWPGWLERPFSEGDIRTIDRTYPYASTGDGTLDLHHGVEFPNKYGTPVLAAHAGEVVFAGTDNMTKLGPFGGFYGNVIVLRHPNLLSEDRDVFTLYAHLSEIGVAVGDDVESGEAIGKVGATGAADGPHLHFEVRVDVNDYAHTVNPVLWFAPLDDLESDDSAMLAGLILDRGGTPVPHFSLTLEKLTDEGPVERHYYPETYYPTRVNEHPLLGENFVVPDIPAGNYRLAFISGRMYEFFFELKPGSLGFIKVQLD
jgi:murein DD-endopeptidase MepM/ murein hydrolase activator NlpD